MKTDGYHIAIGNNVNAPTTVEELRNRLLDMDGSRKVKVAFILVEIGEYVPPPLMDVFDMSGLNGLIISVDGAVRQKDD